MAITITSVKGLGGTSLSPSTIEVTGTIDNCEELTLTVSCSNNAINNIQGTKVPGTTVRNWTISVPNDKGCPCGSTITVKASCIAGLGQGYADSIYPNPTGTPIILDCDPPNCCDEVVLTRVTSPLPCIPVGGGNVQIRFAATLLPTGCVSPNPFEWLVRNVTTGAIIQPYTAGGPNFSYNFNTAETYRVSVRVAQDRECNDTLLTDGEEFTLLNCVTTPCAISLLGPVTTDCTDGLPTAPQTYTATTSKPFTGTYSWEVFKSPGTMPIHQSQGGAAFTFAFPGPGDYTVNVSIQTQGCANPTASSSVSVKVDPCPDTTACTISLSGPVTTDCTDGPPTAPQTYTATTSKPFTGTYSWEVFKTPDTMPIHQSQGGAAFTYAFPGPGEYTVMVRIQTQGCTNPTADSSVTVIVPPCPDTTPPTCSFTLCCILIWWWGLSHLAVGSLLYFKLWPAALISAGFATLALVLWIILCCWPCALSFWRCCTLLRWVAMFNDVLVVTLFGLYALGAPGAPAVLMGFGLLSTLVRILMAASRCGSVPNIFDPSTYPPCRCP